MMSSPNLQQGFTLIEMVVVLFIFVMMTGLVMFNFQGFSRLVNVDVLAHDFAIEIKNAQTLGSASLGDMSASSSSVVSFYIEHDSSASQYENNIATIRETSASVSPDSSDFVYRDILVQGGVIRSVQECNPTCSDINDDVLISFRRPDPEPIVTSPSCGGAAVSGFSWETCLGSIQITLIDENDSSVMRQIVVEPSGYIGVLY